jgi:OOP family OmpA-OmpF porin
MSYKKLLLLATGLSAALAVNADSQDGQWSINPAVGYQGFDNSRGLDAEELISIGAEYRFGNNWGVEIRAMDSSPDYENIGGQNSGAGNVDLTQYGIDGLYYFEETGKISPYAAAGFGHAEFEGDSRTDKESQFDVGMGFRYMLNHNWSVKADAKLIYGIDDDNLDNLFTVGLSYSFGDENKPAPMAVDGDADADGVSDSNDQCPKTPAGAAVDARGCALDSDNDGVADYKDACPDTPAGRQVDDRGCKHVLKRTEEVSLNVNFASSSSVVEASYNSEISRVAEFMEKFAGVTSVIEGHTDDTGSAKFNESLSQKRADAVMKVLVDRFGINAARLSAKGYGEARPIQDNDSAEGRNANRRVVAVMKAEIEE